ncbi:MAG: regulatory protein RecX [Longimicrobiaceae bacterium]
MKITALRRPSPRSSRIELHLNGEPRALLPAAVVAEAGLRMGDHLDEERLGELEREAERWRAREAALRLLAHRARSRAGLARRLREKGFGGEASEWALERLESAGLLDDRAFAEALVRDRLRFRPSGRRRLKDELRAEGVDREVADGVVDEVFSREEGVQLELCRRAATKWRQRGGEDPLRARRRLYGYLARRGFDPEAIRAVCDERLGEPE